MGLGHLVRPKTDPMRFYQLCRKKNREETDPLKAVDGDRVSFGHEINKIMNKYLST